MITFEYVDGYAVRFANHADWLEGKTPPQVELIPCTLGPGEPTGSPPFFFTPTHRICGITIGKHADGRLMAIASVMGDVNRYYFYIASSSESHGPTTLEELMALEDKHGVAVGHK